MSSRYNFAKGKDLMVRGAQIRDMDDKSLTVDIIVNDFTQRDSHGTTFDPNAFNNSILTRGPKAGEAFRLRHLKHHDQRQDAIGKPLEIPYDNQVLRVIGGITPSQRGREHYEDIKFGLFEYSIGFYTLATDPKDDSHITEVDWWEYSSVTFGSNPGTKTLAVRHSILKQSEQLQAVEEHADRIDIALHKGNYSDERFAKMEQELKELRAMVEKLTSAKTTRAVNNNNSISPEIIKSLFKN